jgi:uncharacterized membrane protein
MTARLQTIGLTALMLGVLLLGTQFVPYSIDLGVTGLMGGLQEHRLHAPSATANTGLYLHMIGGGVITALAPLQLIPGIRRRWPALHRLSGRVLVVLALAAGFGGLTYILLHGTVGGLHMSVAFAVYGLLVIWAAAQTARHARARRFPQHQDWAVRLFFLCIASLLYRVHYGLWYATTGGLGTSGLEAGMTGWFDRINIWAFYVPYLLAVELVLWRRGRGLFAKGAAR